MLLRYIKSNVIQYESVGRYFDIFHLHQIILVYVKFCLHDSCDSNFQTNSKFCGINIR